MKAELELAYLAGIIDGEGSIQITNNHHLTSRQKGRI